MTAASDRPQPGFASGFDAGPAICRLLTEHDRALYRALFGSSAVMAGVGPVLDARAADVGFANALAHNRKPLTEASARFWRIAEAAGGAGVGLLAMVRQPVDAAELELGLMLLPVWQGCGLGTAAASAALVHLRAMLPGIAGFTARTGHDNPAAAALFRGLGFVETAAPIAKPWTRSDSARPLRYWRLPIGVLPLR